MINPDHGHNVESPRKAVEVWTLELDAMREYGCLMVLTNHPYLSGRPARVRALRSLIEFALESGDVEITTGSAIADRVLADPDASVRMHEPIAVDPALYPQP